MTTRKPPLKFSRPSTAPYPKKGPADGNPAICESNISSDEQTAERSDDAATREGETISHPAVDFANRNVITQLRDQKKLIDRLKQEKAALEDLISLMQHELRLQQHMQHSLVTSKQLHDNNLLPNLISDVPTDRTPGGNVQSPVRPILPGRASPRRACATVPMTTADHRELEILRLKVHNLESEKQQRTEEFAAQSKAFFKRIKKLEHELSEKLDIIRAKDAEIHLLHIRTMHRAQLQHGGSPTHGLLSDEMWSSVPVLKTCIASHTGKTDTGKAYDSLIAKSFVDMIQHLPGNYHEQWLKDLQETAHKLSRLHSGLKALCGVFDRLASCADLYEMVQLIAKEAQCLVDAEEAYIFVADPMQKQEFWSRIKGDDGEIFTSRSFLPHIPFEDQLTYSNYLSELPYHTNHENTYVVSKPATEPASLLAHPLVSSSPPGFAAYVFHTKEVLNVPGCTVLGHPLHSTSHRNTDRFMKVKSASTMLIPMCYGDENECLAVLQVCGKVQNVHGIGVQVSLEGCMSFTDEDKWILMGLANFCGGLMAKVMTFTEVERTRRSETLLLALSRQIFTCLDFPKLSKLVMQSTRELLETDRCTLFVAKSTPNNEQVLSAWISDVQGEQATWKNRGHEIVVQMGKGIAGACAETRQLINVPDAYYDDRFDKVKTWDERTKYRTKSILAMPIIGSTGNLLGVIQMINKAGGTTFKAMDEEYIASVSQLIALAMENSNLFQKTQEVSKCIGPYIRCLPLNEALVNLTQHTEDVVGVQGACIYLVEDRTNELFTYHRERKTRVDLKPLSYKKSIMANAISLKEPLIVNNVYHHEDFNQAVDSLPGIAAHQVMFVPIFQHGKNGVDEKTFVGLLDLVNRKGTSQGFDYDDSLVAIMANQISGILMSITERQILQQLHEDTKMLLDTCMSFFKESNHVGIMNAVCNATRAAFTIEKGQLWLWTADKTHMWTSKTLEDNDVKFVNPTLHRRMSVSAFDREEVSCSEGLMKRVLAEGKVVSIRRWEYGEISSNASAEGVQRITATDRKASFIQYSITACPVWDSFGIEVIGVILLMSPRGRCLTRLELSKIPILTRQITAALMVCHDVSKHIHRVKRMQDLVEEYTAGTRSNAPLYSPSLLSLSHHTSSPSLSSQHGFSLAIKLNMPGMVDTSTYPINMLTPGLEFCSKYDLLRLPVDSRGDRHVIQVTRVTQALYESTHFDKWLGHDTTVGDWEKIKFDLHNAFSRKDTLAAFYNQNNAVSLSYVNNFDFITASSSRVSLVVNKSQDVLTESIRREIAVFLWPFCMDDLMIHLEKVALLFSPFDVDSTGHIKLTDFEFVMRSWGVNLCLDDFQAIHAAFKMPPNTKISRDEKEPYVCYRDIFKALAPRFIRHKHFHHEIFPTLHPTTHKITSIQLFLTPTSNDVIVVPTLKDVVTVNQS
ncbi:hypothetical protein AeRB84_011119 [Aphanomyces euteiches]|nr:hypothetical protein AeRB84_011119 [Aphanomyces euteiches]